SDWVAMLRGGTIAAMAPPAEFQRTADPDIREFIGAGDPVAKQVREGEGNGNVRPEAPLICSRALIACLG
ncbi:MAG TPA: hypothetical protein VN203_29155, partial [Candidatus Acidoferrum sp.]|nr:hypothetical protein [Candidatus Acidoferrum sp.]